MNDDLKSGLFHVTPSVRAALIDIDQQVKPSFARGKRKVVWAVGFDRLSWALAHVSFKHGVSVQSLSILRIAPHVGFKPQATKWDSVFTIAAPCFVVGRLSLREYFALSGPEVKND